MREVKFASMLVPDPVIRQLPETRRGAHEVHLYAERKMKGLIERQLVGLKALPSTAALKQAVGTLMQTEWVFLRGQFASQFIHVEREAQILIECARRRELVEVRAEDGDELPAAPTPG